MTAKEEIAALRAEIEDLKKIVLSFDHELGLVDQVRSRRAYMAARGRMTELRAITKLPTDARNTRLAAMEPTDRATVLQGVPPTEALAIVADAPDARTADLWATEAGRGGLVADMLALHRSGVPACVRVSYPRGISRTNWSIVRISSDQLARARELKIERFGAKLTTSSSVDAQGIVREAADLQPPLVTAPPEHPTAGPWGLTMTRAAHELLREFCSDWRDDRHLLVVDVPADECHALALAQLRAERDSHMRYGGIDHEANMHAAKQGWR